MARHTTINQKVKSEPNIVSTEKETAKIVNSNEKKNSCGTIAGPTLGVAFQNLD